MDSSNKSPAPTPTGASLSNESNAGERPLTRQQRNQLFDEAAKGIVPENGEKKSEDLLRGWWPQIQRKLQQGFSLRQVHAMVNTPKINLGIGLRTFHRLVKQHQAARTKAVRRTK